MFLRHCFNGIPWVLIFLSLLSFSRNSAVSFYFYFQQLLQYSCLSSSCLSPALFGYLVTSTYSMRFGRISSHQLFLKMVPMFFYAILWICLVFTEGVLKWWFKTATMITGLDDLPVRKTSENYRYFKETKGYCHRMY